MTVSARQRARISRGAQYAVLAAAVIVLIVVADWGQLQRAFFDPAVAAAQFPAIITVALKNTLIYTALGFVVGLSGGVLLALMRMSSVAPYRWLATIYIEFFRGVPALLVFIAFGYGIPTAFGVRFDTYVTVMLALGMVSAAYIAETLRAGLQAVPKGQLEAARSLGMSHSRAMVSIVIPQAFRIVLPPLTNEVILLTKDSSLVYLLGLALTQYELTKFGREAISSGGGLTPLVLAGVCYLIITVPLGLLARRFESRTERKAR
ncbi:amino acid ABC transporter permease [Mycetocola reblochoni]|uniref:Polar amino acid ABC transporter, inner membrane subunit n=2 Tax=Mycetocola reblochoni TaxID=331618 RepID=A0A1R4II14_9MICO|nr:amino acid ABC transporter permease [Mycetocola reblochoni]RLP69652.1 amino acid ABC transporter permease [Mycetocola reblochoni]SJN19467.1 polar amino acid ABC transporter, inner membrane subunit [Mycetocola reblochoni REB411]